MWRVKMQTCFKKTRKRVDGERGDNANIFTTKRLNGECEE